MNKISFLSGNCNMDNANLEMVIKNNISDGIVIRSTEGFSDKGEEIRTTEYFLDVQDQSVNEENADAQFLSVSEDNGNNQFIAVEVEDSGEIILHNKNVIIWSDICRICANGSDQFIPIFNGEGLENDLSNKINNYLPLKVSEDDNFPHQVCYSCAATLIAWHDMLTGCLEAQQQLEELQTKINLKDQLYNDTATEEDNIQSVTEIDTVTIEDKKINLKEDSSMETIQSIDTIESDRPSPTPSKMSVESTSDGNSFVYMCGICEKLYKSESDLRSHLNEDHVDSTDFRSLNPLRYECNVCRKTYIQKENLINHMQSHASTLSGEDAVVERCKVFRNQMLGFKCEKCGQVLSNRRTFLRHIRVHTNERPVICHICGKSYRIEDDLKRHIDDVHMKIKRFACDLCNKPFAAKATRDAHRRIHTGEKPFTCGTCGKTFRSINLLGIHKRVHTDYRPHACSYCEKAFRNKQKLTIHECIHTGIRPFACDVCGKLFAAKGEARRHRSVHFADKPFLCSECGLGFRLNRYLKTHIKTHHEARVDTAEEPMEKN